MINATEYLSMSEQEQRAYCRNQWIEELAYRIIDVDYYGAMDADESLESIVDELKNDPLTIISDLLDVIADYQD